MSTIDPKSKPNLPYSYNADKTRTVNPNYTGKTPAQSYNQKALTQALVDRGGYNPTDAANAAANKGGRAVELAKEFLGGGGGGSTLAEPTSTDQLPDYFKTFQQKAFNLLDDVPTEESLAEKLTPDATKPDPINRLEMLKTQTELHGIEDLNTELNTIKTDEREILATLRETTGVEEGKPVALGVMAGRIGEEERQARTKLDWLAVRKSSIVDELSTKYNAINTYINYAGLDYQDAVQAYEGDFNRNVQVQNLLSGFRQEAFGYAMDTIKLGETIKQNNIDNARANLSTMMNAITAGNISFDALGSDEKLQIQKLEIQAGLPVGTTASMKEKVDPKANLMFTTSNEGITQMGFLQPDGTIKTVEAGRRISSSSTKTDKKQEVLSELQQELDRLGGDDKFVSSEEWNYIRLEAIKNGVDGKEFDDAFKNTYVGNPESRGFSSEDFGFESKTSGL